MIHRIRRAILDLIRRNRAERELDEELRTHLEHEIEQNLAQGMNSEEAHYAAQRLFGGVQQVKERCRDVRGLNFIETVIQDLRYGLRQVRRNPGFTAVAALGVRAAAGRLIGPEDVHMGYHAPVAVVSWSLWKSRFDLDPGIIGKKIIVDDAPVTIIGVTQRGFYGLSEQATQDIWLPISLGPSRYWGFALLGRLKPGVSIEQARAQMAVPFQTAVDAPDAGPFVRGMKLRIEPAGHGVSTPLRETLSTPLIVLMGMVGLLLLLACANLAGLLLARAASRQHEMAVRVCLGAGRARLIRQTLTESLLLSMAGSALGIFLAYLGTRGLIRIFASGRQIRGLPVHFEALSNPDGHVLLFTSAVAIRSGTRDPRLPPDSGPGIAAGGADWRVKISAAVRKKSVLDGGKPRT